MKRVLLTGLAALVGVAIVGDTSEAGLFGRRRAYRNNCSTCNACVPQDQQYYDPSMGPGPGNAPPPAPNAQTYYGPNQQGNTTFYRGQPQPAPNQPGRFQSDADLQGRANVGARQGQTDADIQGRTNLNSPQGGANLQGNPGANLNQGGGGARTNAGTNVNPND